MYSRNLIDTCISGYIFIVLLQFSRRTYHVRTAKTSLYNKNLSAKSIYHKIPRVHYVRTEEYDELDFVYRCSDFTVSFTK